MEGKGVDVGGRGSIKRKRKGKGWGVRGWSGVEWVRCYVGEEGADGRARV
mgnify:CR=1 FL=1